MKKLIGTMLVATTVCGLLAAPPARAEAPKDAGAYGSVTTRHVTETQLSRKDIISVQKCLAAEGFYSGSIDGKIGPITTAALTSFQASRGLDVNGMPTKETLDKLGVTPTSVASADDKMAPEKIEPAAGGVTVETTTTSESWSTRTTGGFVAINNDHVNGAACKLCTNGLIGNGGTPSMRSNEY